MELVNTLDVMQNKHLVDPTNNGNFDKTSSLLSYHKIHPFYYSISTIQNFKDD